MPEHFHELARDLDVLEPKTPDDIYKSHLEKRPTSAAAVDSARANLASTFVNAFVNLGFGADKLMLPEGNKWLYKNKEHGMTSAAASLGALRHLPTSPPHLPTSPAASLGARRLRDSAPWRRARPSPLDWAATSPASRRLLSLPPPSTQILSLPPRVPEP